MSGLQRTALAIVIIGALNWGLMGFFQFDIVGAIFGGQDSTLTRIIFGIVGLAGLYCLTLLFKPSEEFARESEAEPSR